jgi:hypothetical protein
MTKKSRKAPVNETAKRELELFVDNDKPSYDALKKTEIDLASVICRKKTYSIDLAARSFERALMVGAKRYEKEHGTPGSATRMFNKSTRDELAREYATDFKRRVNEYLNVDVVARDADFPGTSARDREHAAKLRADNSGDLTKEVANKLTTCKAMPLAGRRTWRRRRR